MARLSSFTSFFVPIGDIAVCQRFFDVKEPHEGREHVSQQDIAVIDTLLGVQAVDRFYKSVFFPGHHNPDDLVLIVGADVIILPSIMSLNTFCTKAKAFLHRD